MKNLELRKLVKGTIMENSRIAALAGIVMEKKKWSGDVKAKVEVPEGTFTKKASSIVSTLIKLHDGDVGKASKALNFYINRAGKDVENKEELNTAKEMFKEKVKAKNESINVARRLAGLAPLVEAKDEEEEEVPAEGDEGKKGDEEEDLPKIVKKIAKQAEGKDVEKLEELIMKVYEAGFKDGKKAAEEGDEEEGKDKEEVAEGQQDISKTHGHFSVKHEDNMKNAAAALAKGGHKVDVEHHNDQYYFNFKSKDACDKAKKVADKVIDKKKEA